VLPLAWKERLGKITTVRKIDCETATRILSRPRFVVRSRFDSTVSIPFMARSYSLPCILATDMYEPLIGYIILEQCQAAVDMLGHAWFT